MVGEQSTKRDILIYIFQIQTIANTRLGRQQHMELQLVQHVQHFINIHTFHYISGDSEAVDSRNDRFKIGEEGRVLRFR
jgi:hypothetical protein